MSINSRIYYDYNSERDFKSDYLFRICSLATNLVTSLEFNPTRCATTMCHFGQTWNGSVANHFILLSSTAESSATSGYVVVPERLGQNEEPAGNNKERAKEKPSLVPNVNLVDAIVFPKHVFIIFYDKFCVFYLFMVYFFSTFFLWKIFSIFC